MKPIKKKYRIHLILLGVILILAILAFKQGSWNQVWNGLVSGLTILVKELPLLSAAFITAGFLQTLIKREFITRWLGSESGIKGILLACIGGGLIPGGPYAYYPIAGALLKSGAGLGVLIAFVSAKNLWSVSRIPWEFAILGTTITIQRYLITFLIPPLFGLISEWIFGNQIEKIRDGVEE
jgi:uncharacterized membrane protein YraQ (UPF0718 family)